MIHRLPLLRSLVSRIAGSLASLVVSSALAAFVALAVFAATTLLCAPSARAENHAPPAEPAHFPGGSFEPAELKAGAGGPWSNLPPGATIEAEERNHFLRLTVINPGKQVLVYRAITLTPEDKALDLTFRVRFAGIEVGDKPWFDGRIMMNFKDKAGKVLQPGPPPPAFKGSSAKWETRAWETRAVKFLVPDGATTLEVMFALFNAKAGTLDFDDVRLSHTDPATVEKPISMASPVVDAPSADRLPPELKVLGNKIVTVSGPGAGKEVWLQGVSIDSLEWSATGDLVVKSTEVAITDWKANVIRCPVREDFWFGKSDGQTDDGAAYRKLVDSVINTATGRRAYVVLDLHRFRAPEQIHADFWKDAATRYKNHPGVLFELFNEPHDISWDVWKNGGLLTNQKKT